MEGTSKEAAETQYVEILEAVRIIIDVLIGGVVTANFSGPMCSRSTGNSVPHREWRPGVVEQAQRSLIVMLLAYSLLVK